MIPNLATNLDGPLPPIYNLLFFDLETGGFSPRNDAILELGAILTNKSATRVIQTLNLKLTPEPGTEIHAAAAAVNHYDPAIWALESIPLHLGLSQLDALLAAGPVVIVGHTPFFDWSFLSVVAERNSWYPTNIYGLINTQDLAPGRLSDICDRLHIEIGLRHTALADAAACRQIYLRSPKTQWGPPIHRVNCWWDNQSDPSSRIKFRPSPNSLPSRTL